MSKTNRFHQENIKKKTKKRHEFPQIATNTISCHSIVLCEQLFFKIKHQMDNVHKVLKNFFFLNIYLYTWNE